MLGSELKGYTEQFKQGHPHSVGYIQSQCYYESVLFRRIYRGSADAMISGVWGDCQRLCNKHKVLHNLTVKATWHFRLGLYLCRFCSDALSATGHHSSLSKSVIGSEEQGICVLLVSDSFDTTPVHINSTQKYIASSNL